MYNFVFVVYCSTLDPSLSLRAHDSSILEPHGVLEKQQGAFPGPFTHLQGNTFHPLAPA